MFRTTRRPAEMRAVDVIVGALLDAGFRGNEAAVVYRAWADFSLSFSGGEASFRAMDAQAQAQDRQAWAGAYLTADRATHPSIWRVRAALPKVTDDAIFTTVLGLVMDGLVLRAPVPCSCGRHLPRARRADP
jgi:hypothetical protein